jgi:hypothetical protein
MRTQPPNAEGPKPLHSVDMDFTKPVSVIITRIFTSPMTDSFVFIAPLWQWIVDGVLVGVNLSAECNRCPDERFNGCLFDRAHASESPLPHPVESCQKSVVFPFRAYLDPESL